MVEILITTFYIIVCIALFSLAVIVHEAGHLIAALKFGLKVEASPSVSAPCFIKRLSRASNIVLARFP